MGAYYHADFLRGQPALARSIKRMPIKGLASSTRRPPITAATTPNFYAMRPLPPIDADASSNAESRVLHSFVQHYGLHVMQQHWLQRHASQALMETRQRLGASSPVSTQPSLKVTCPLIVDTATVGESKSSPQSQREAHIQENRDEHNGIVIVPWPSPTQKAVGCTLGY
jgi:hypothetical protein